MTGEPQYGWKRGASALDWLYAEPWMFDFYQAVRLLEMVHEGDAGPGEAQTVLDEPVRLRSLTSLAFPASDVTDLRPGRPPELTVSFFGLGGVHGPLPYPDTERILERVFYRDHAFRDFLDIFHHRLLACLYRVRKLHHPGLAHTPPSETPVSGWLFSTFGLGLPQLRNRLDVPDASLLYYAGILSHHPRNVSGLERILSDFLGVRATVNQLVGRWRTLDTDQWTRIGRTGVNQTLGTTATAGTRVWDQHSSFEVVLGPMNFDRFGDLLPGGRGYVRACELIRFHAGSLLDFTIRLVIEGREVRQAALGSARLGWTSWLRTKPASEDDSQVRLRPAGVA